MSLAAGVIHDALNVDAHGGSVGRAIINGAVVIYDLDAPPEWLAPILQARDEDGNVILEELARASEEMGIYK